MASYFRLDTKINILQQRKIYLLDEISALEEFPLSKFPIIWQASDEEKSTPPLCTPLTTISRSSPTLTSDLIY